MPPKAGSSSPQKKQASTKKEEPVEWEPPTMNPDVLLYLEVVSKRFPKLESGLVRFAENCDKEKVKADAELEKTTTELSCAVRSFSQDRGSLVTHVHDLRKQLQDISQRHAESVATFDVTLERNKVADAEEIQKLEEEVARLEKDAAEAEDWSYRVHRKKNELATLNDNIEETIKRQKAELKDLEVLAEAEKRKLRDSLVRKLRRARDQLTSQTDDEISGKGSHTDEMPLSALSASTVPSAKQNEKLSREVTMYERDCEAIRQQNRNIAKEEETFLTSLKTEKASNSLLVARNASHLKAKRILQQQLKEVQGQFVGAMDQHHAQHADRLKAFRETVSSQAALVDDLQSELELHFEEYDEMMAKLRVREVDAARSEADVRTSVKFLHSCRQSEDPKVRGLVEQLLPYFATSG